MKKLLTIALFGILTTQSYALSAVTEETKEAFKSQLAERLKGENLLAIKEYYSNDLNILAPMHERNVRFNEIQANQNVQPSELQVFTRPFNYISPKDWEKIIADYIDSINLIKITQQDHTELQFEFPPLEENIQKDMNLYGLSMPTVTLNTILLSSGKEIAINKPLIELLAVPFRLKTDGSSILKLNLTITYQVPNKTNSQLIFNEANPKHGNIIYTSDIPNVATLILPLDQAEKILHIDARDQKGNTLASQNKIKIANFNELPMQEARIVMTRALLTAIEDKTVQNPQQAIDFIVEHADEYLRYSTDRSREVTKDFLGTINEITLYLTSDIETKNYDFSLY